MSARRNKKRIEPEGPDRTAADPVSGRSRKARRKGRRSATSAQPATPIPEALAAITADLGGAPQADPTGPTGPTTPVAPVASSSSSSSASSAPEASVEAAEIAALTTRHRTEALTPTAPEPIAPRMRAFRLPALVVVVALLVGAALVDRRDADPTVDTSAPTDLARMAPVASAPDARSSTFYCAGGTALGSTDPVEPSVVEEPTPDATSDPGSSTGSPDATTVAAGPDPVVAEHRVTIANFSDRDQQAVVTVVPSVGDKVVETRTVAARTRTTVTLSDLVQAPQAAALVETDGGEVAVEHEVEGPHGRAVSSCASSAASSWYFPAGTTRLGTRHVYSVFNPFPQQAVVDFSFMVSEDGGRQATRRSDKLEGILVPPQSVVAVDITDIITVRDQVATTVTTRSGLGRVVVDQVMDSDGRSNWPESLSLTLGAPVAAPTWLFADNRPLGDGVETSFVAYNPGSVDADVEIYVEVDGQAPGTRIEPFVVTVRAGQYASVPVGADTRIPVGFGAFVVAVSRNDVPVVVERVMRQTEPVDPDGATFTIGSPLLARSWLVPVGGIDGQESMQVSVANPSVSETVTLTVDAVGEGDQGALDDFDGVTLAPGARTVVDLSDAQGAASLMLRVRASGPVIVGQWFAFDDPGTLSDVVPFPVAGSLVLPGGEVVDRSDTDVVEPEPYDGPLPDAGTVPPGTTPTTEAPPGSDVIAPDESTTSTAPDSGVVPAGPDAGVDPATGAAVDPNAPTTVAPG